MSTKVTSKVRDLPFFALFALGFGSMMGAGVFDLPQNISHRSGAFAVMISWVIVSIGMLALAWSFVYICNKRPEIKSGIYGYAKYGFGDYVGFNSAWGYWLNALLGNVSYLIYIFAILGKFFGFFGQEGLAGNTLPAFIGESLLIWIVFFLIIQGIHQASLANIVITTIKLLALTSVVVVFIYGFHWDIFLKNISLPSPHLGSALQQVKSTMLVTVWDFLGIEAACIYATHARSMKDVGRATVLALVTVLLIDILISCLPLGILSTSVVQTLQTPSTAGVMAVVVGGISADLIRCAVMICVVGALLAWQMLGMNILHLAAKDQTMPQFLTKLNAKKVPRNSALACSIVLQIFLTCAFFTKAVYLTMIQVATSLILVPYLLAALYAFKLIIIDKKFYWYDLIRGSLAVIYSIWMIHAGGLKYLAISTLLYVCGIIVFAIARREVGKKMFANKYEVAMCWLVILLAGICGYSWYSGLLVLG